MKKLMKLVVAVSLTISAGVAVAGDVELGSKKAVLCMSCHGAKGVSNGPLWPNLAGQKAGYLAKQMRDFKNGVRKDPMMEPLLKQLSDEDIENIAAYFSAQKAIGCDQ